MQNKAMQRKLRDCTCVDVSGCPRTVIGDYVLTQFDLSVDYCDAEQEAWIWSIGQLLRPLPSVMADGSRLVLPTGTFLASRSTRMYTQDTSDTIKCVWLR